MQDKKLTKQEKINKIRLAILSSGLKQIEIAKSLGIHHVALNLYLKGKREPSDDIVNKLSGFLNIDLSTEVTDDIQKPKLSDDYWMRRAMRAEATLTSLRRQLQSMLDQTFLEINNDVFFAAEDEG